METKIDIFVVKKGGFNFDIAHHALWISCPTRHAVTVDVLGPPITVDASSSPRINIYTEDDPYAYITGTILMDNRGYILTTSDREVLTVRLVPQL